MPDSHLDDDGFVVLDNPAEIRAQEIARCGLCDVDGYIGGTVCDHIDHRQAARRGMELVREALAHRISEKQAERGVQTAGTDA